MHHALNCHFFSLIPGKPRFQPIDRILCLVSNRRGEIVRPVPAVERGIND